MRGIKTKTKDDIFISLYIVIVFELLIFDSYVKFIKLIANPNILSKHLFSVFITSISIFESKLLSQSCVPWFSPVHCFYSTNTKEGLFTR